MQNWRVTRTGTEESESPKPFIQLQMLLTKDEL
jgi:hypothetical protein